MLILQCPYTTITISTLGNTVSLFRSQKQLSQQTESKNQVT